MPNISHTARLRIEPLKVAHATAMLPALLDPRIYRYIPSVRYDTVDGLAARYRRLEAGSADSAQRWLNRCLFRSDSGAAIGNIQATVFLLERTADIAYVLSPDNWGRGYASEAVIWLLAHLKAAGDVEFVHAQIDTRNAASIALVERLGFERQADVLDGDAVDRRYQMRL